MLPFHPMKKIILPAIATLALFGAGCAPATTPAPAPAPVPAAPAAAVQTPPPAAPESTGTPAGSTTTSSDHSLTTESTSMDQSLHFPGVLPASETEGKYVHIQTPKGEIVFQLLPKEGPNAASNFVYLVQHKFYDGLTFHRVVPGFVIQGGDPKGDGTGGPGYQFADDPVSMSYNEGVVAMANAGPNTNGSQFFIMLGDNPLPPSYSIFGKVVKGMDVVKQIAIGDTMTSVTLTDSE